jgi:small subunit ribosomal protein S6
MTNLTQTHRTYKTFIFFQPNLEKNAVLEILARYYKVFSSRNAKFCFKNFGTKLFSYPIKGFSSGTYVQMTFTGNAELVKEINKQLTISEGVIRHITVKKDN